MTSPALIALADLPSTCPEWPLSPWSTAQLIRDGSLGCVRMGRRKFVTREMLAAYSPAQKVRRPSSTDPLLESIYSEMCRVDLECAGPRPDGFTYVIRPEGSHLVKIGRAEDPVKRLLDLQRMNHAPLTLLGICHGERSESVLHAIHQASRRHGEWFEIRQNPIKSPRACWSCNGGIESAGYER